MWRTLIWNSVVDCIGEEGKAEIAAVQTAVIFLTGNNHAHVFSNARAFLHKPHSGRSPRLAGKHLPGCCPTPTTGILHRQRQWKRNSSQASYQAPWRQLMYVCVTIATVFSAWHLKRRPELIFEIDAPLFRVQLP